MKLNHHSKSCQIIINKKITNFENQATQRTADTTPDSISSGEENLKTNYFIKKISSDCKLARELHEASLQSHWYIEQPKETVDKRLVKLKKQQKNQKVVVLDLDETLIYHKNDQTKIRPYCKQFLERLSKICTLVLFTAAKIEHATNMLKLIDPNKQYFKSVCTLDNMIGKVKDLRIFSTDLKDIVIVDNSPQNFIAQINNGLPILPFEGQNDDNQLEELLSYLEDLLLVEDVRVELAKTFKLQQFYKQLNGKQAINKLYI
ncbi:unnamed protein product (macronuclear) [Paramecium tetraurelia]|uniref:Mitochondrial import inner membrane translocase subunit TIM50 n=1 Tax=Paramecium tetraurelia TaxID=5888 RepID=A0CR85_PARTE|nr:uncharacterized protein GSPATT00009617001 [Paramecium tetraurelia]CAK73302.1 unnamed protein product [Paramecium tetraurelia]|eukprot:XP_001440699.1 hypothetical protein (macronuclear) [Paramecium tetraurelia strain d4-2]